MLEPTRIDEQNIALEEIHPCSNWKEFDRMTNLMDVSEQILPPRVVKGAHNNNITKLLMGRSNIETNLKDEDRQTLLLHIAREGHETLVKLLLARGDVEANLEDEDRPTDAAFTCGRGGTRP